MKTNQHKKYLLLSVLVFSILLSYGQKKGNLFIIGGGDRSAELMVELIKTADLKVGDYIVVLPMASAEPEESSESMRKEFLGLCKNPVASFKFNRDQANNQLSWIDSVRNAKLIYITGGDQSRFMDVVKGTKLFDAMHECFNNGATIAGTSAGAAVMSAIMITGEEKDKKDNGEFREIKNDNTVTSQGMGFITEAIIDQHFIKRSRFNQLISILADHPDKMVIGIDEGTAIIVKGKKIRVVGESQVVVISKPKKQKKSPEDRIGFENAQLSLFVSGDSFKLE